MDTFAHKLGALLLLFMAIHTTSAQHSWSSTASASNAGMSNHLGSSSPNTPEAIINAFIATETKVREALNQYTFKRDVLLQTIGPNGEVTGQYIRNSQFLFDDMGNRIERVFYRPKSTLKGMKISREDIQDLEGAQLLGIDVTETSKYRLEYAGTEDDQSGKLIVITVTPVQTPNPKRMRERFFVGRIWVDPTTFQIVKVHGKVEPQGKQRFPTFQTRREPLGDQFLFPSTTEADDILRFPKIEIHYRVKVRCYDYKRFASKLTLTEVDPSDE